MLVSLARGSARFAAVLALAAGFAACSGATSDETASDDVTAGETTGDGAFNALSEMSLGSPDAPVTVIEYASVTCPHCAAFNEVVFPDIKANYIDTGKVRYVFREFPTAPANLSVAGSMLARCAAEKGGVEAFFLVVDTLFKTQQTWIYGGDTRQELIKIASQVGMDEAAFDACTQRQELLDRINEIVKVGNEKYDIIATPSFLINGQLRRIRTFEEFTKALDEAIEKAVEKDN